MLKMKLPLSTATATHEISGDAGGNSQVTTIEIDSDGGQFPLTEIEKTDEGFKFSIVGTWEASEFFEAMREFSKEHPNLRDSHLEENKGKSVANYDADPRFKVEVGEKARFLTYQETFYPIIACSKEGCIGNAELVMTVMDRYGKIAAIKSDRPEGSDVGLWPHDSCAIATYVCHKCLTPTSLMNQA